ncbi:MAG: hypothetical protein ACO1O1_07720 [Adhaeribacter sp.]
MQACLGAFLVTKPWLPSSCPARRPGAPADSLTPPAAALESPSAPGRILWITAEVLLAVIFGFVYLVILISRSSLSLSIKVFCLFWMIYTGTFLGVAWAGQWLPSNVLNPLISLIPASCLLVLRIFLSYFAGFTLTCLLGYVVLKVEQKKKKIADEQLKKDRVRRPESEIPGSTSYLFFKNLK